MRALGRASRKKNSLAKREPRSRQSHVLSPAHITPPLTSCRSFPTLSILHLLSPLVMLNLDAKLSDKIFAEDIPTASTRDGFGKGTVEAGKNDKNIVVLCADLADSTRAEWFKKEFPERYVEMGVAEQNMATVAAGLAKYGKIPFIASYACFSP